MHRRVRLVIGLAFTLLTAVDLRGAIVPVAIPASTRPDFNGDGKDDLAVGVPGENTGAGGVHIIYGAKGVSPTSAISSLPRTLLTFPAARKTTTAAAPL